MVCVTLDGIFYVLLRKKSSFAQKSLFAISNIYVFLQPWKQNNRMSLKKR